MSNNVIAAITIASYIALWIVTISISLWPG